MANRATPVPGVSGPHQRALALVALDILRNGPGQRIATSLQFQEQLDVGSGTVQKALRQLVDVGAVRLRMKGHQGTLIEAYDPAILWRAADLGPLRLVLTPPGSIESTAIAVESRRQLAMHHVSTEFDFVRGANRRIATLSDSQPRVAAMSRVAAEGYGLLGNPDYTTLDLGALSYYRPETLVVLHRPDVRKSSIRRIARDPESYDHDHLTMIEFPESAGFEYVNCAFPDVPASILAGTADAGVWHQVVTVITPRQAGLVSFPVHWGTQSPLESISSAVFVWRSVFSEIDSLMSLVDPDEIRVVQQRLVNLGIASPEVRETVPWL